MFNHLRCNRIPSAALLLADVCCRFRQELAQKHHEVYVQGTWAAVICDFCERYKNSDPLDLTWTWVFRLIYCLWELHFVRVPQTFPYCPLYKEACGHPYLLHCAQPCRKSTDHKRLSIRDLVKVQSEAWFLFSFRNLAHLIYSAKSSHTSIICSAYKLTHHLGSFN